MTELELWTTNQRRKLTASKLNEFLMWREQFRARCQP